MNKILVGDNISEKCKNSLRTMGCEIVVLPPFSELARGVSNHADMLVYRGKRGIFVHEIYYSENRELFDSLGVKIIKSDEDIGKEYPNDILFNAIVSGEHLFSNTPYTSKLIKEETKHHVFVKQGYTGCSTCKVADNAFITSDKGLYRVYKQYGIDVLLVEKGHIVLHFYDYGFIGGSSVLLGDNLCFFGNIEEHPNYDDIVRFAKKYGVSVVSLSDEKLMDIGSAVVLLEE